MKKDKIKKLEEKGKKTDNEALRLAINKKVQEIKSGKPVKK